MGRALSAEEIKWLLQNLRKLNFFSTTTLENVDKITSRFSAYDFEKGNILVNESTIGNALFVIKSGSCLVYKKVGLLGKKELATLKEGAVLGEMSLISDEPTSATVKAI